MRYLILVAVLSGCAVGAQKPAPGTTPETTKGASYEADLELCESQNIGWAALSPFAHSSKVGGCMNAKGWAMQRPKQDAIPR